MQITSPTLVASQKGKSERQSKRGKKKRGRQNNSTFSLHLTHST